MTKYHDPNSCNACGALSNCLTHESYEEGMLLEAETECTVCGFQDYWAYGEFQSGSEGGGNCETYNFPLDPSE